MKKLQVGDYVDIYQDPITQKDFEGIAQIEEIVSECAENYYLMVRFGAGRLHGRFVSKIKMETSNL